MKTKIYSAILVLIFMMAACTFSSKYKYWELSHFKISKNALADNEEIKILYTSQGPDYNNELKYYIHLVVVSQKTGDTVNILTTAFNGFKKDDGDKIFNYFSPDNIISKYSNINDSSRITNEGGVFENNQKKIDKVARDPEFDNIADNKYPTVIGLVGTISDTVKEIK